MTNQEAKIKAREAEERWNELGQPGFLVEFAERRYPQEVVDFIIEEAMTK